MTKLESRLSLFALTCVYASDRVNDGRGGKERENKEKDDVRDVEEPKDGQFGGDEIREFIVFANILIFVAFV